MKDIDRMIRDALRDEDVEQYDSFRGSETIHELITDLFAMRPRWLLVLSIILTLAAIVAAVWAANNMYHAVEMRDMLLWGLISVTCILGVTAVKVWGWIELSKNALTREIKRLEFQVAILVRVTGEGGQKESDS